MKDLAETMTRGRAVYPQGSDYPVVVIACSEPEEQRGHARGQYALVRLLGKRYQPIATYWYNCEGDYFSAGHYFEDFRAAFEDYLQRSDQAVNSRTGQTYKV